MRSQLLAMSMLVAASIVCVSVEARTNERTTVYQTDESPPAAPLQDGATITLVYDRCAAAVDIGSDHLDAVVPLEQPRSCYEAPTSSLTGCASDRCWQGAEALVTDLSQRPVLPLVAASDGALGDRRG